eukprot:GHVU01217272.1.p1 GENE.GHVU01217272.1~~GHVU01217272.1.p1  ORF type:complete len:125 (-),score=29.68 GHVU01217272.1:1422-1796(-)
MLLQLVEGPAPVRLRVLLMRFHLSVRLRPPARLEHCVPAEVGASPGLDDRSLRLASEHHRFSLAAPVVVAEEAHSRGSLLLKAVEQSRQRVDAELLQKPLAGGGGAGGGGAGGRGGGERKEKAE